MSDAMTLDQAVEKVKSQVDKARDEVKAIADEALGKAANGEKLSQSAKDKADEALTALNTVKEQFAELEQKIAQQGRGGEERVKSLGEQFVEAEGVKSLVEQGSRFRGTAKLELKATLTSATSASAGSVGDGNDNTRIPGIVTPAQRRMTIRMLIAQGQMDGNALEYVKETGFTNNADMVAEGAAKPQSDITLDLVTTSAKVIAHYIKASRQVLDDVAQLRSQVDSRLLYGLALKEEGQILNGDGTGQNLNGINTQATAYAAPFDPAGTETAIDILRLGMLQVALAEYPADGIVLNPIDWARIELTKDAEGRYIIGNPQGAIAPTLWGAPVVATQAQTVDKFTVGAWQLGAQLFDRWQASVAVATENEDDFIKNLVTILAEERLALAVYRPEAFVFGDLGFVA